MIFGFSSPNKVSAASVDLSHSEAERGIGYAAYEKSQGQSNVQGGSQYNAGAGNQGADLDLQGAANSAKSQASRRLRALSTSRTASDLLADQDSSLFDTALSFLQQKKDSGDTDVDEDAVQNDHHQIYDKGESALKKRHKTKPECRQRFQYERQLDRCSSSNAST